MKWPHCYLPTGASKVDHAARFYLGSLGSSKVLLSWTSGMPLIPYAGIKCWRLCNTRLPVLILLSILCTLPPPSLFWSEKIIQSSEGVQQGYPLGPLLFCLTIHHVSLLVKSELCIFYLDDGTLGGILSDVFQDIEVMKKEAGVVGLELNLQKSEVI